MCNPPLPISIIFFHATHTNKITIYAQSPKRHQPSAHVICPNETVGAVPVCPPECLSSGVFIREMDFVHHALCVGIERWMRPCGATRAGTQAPPLPNSIIFFHAIPHKQNNHSRAIHPNEAVGAAPMCPPEHPRSGVSIREVGFVHHALCAGNLTMDAPLWGDTGGHIGTAPTKLRYTFMRNPPSTTPTIHV